MKKASSQQIETINDCDFKKVAVLLAAFDGEKWLNEQLDSILNQKDVNVHIFISIDQSTDNTEALISQLIVSGAPITLVSHRCRFGSAGKNFQFLFKATSDLLEEFDFVALSDQDDIWKLDKLKVSINELYTRGVDAVSSNVEAFWDVSGRRKTIVKSQPQNSLDHFFESAGPGCTFVMRRCAFNTFQQRLIEKPHLFENIEYHDWLLYAFCRENDLKWHIIDSPLLHYRQHETNQLGANTGLAGVLNRIKLIRNHAYREQAILIANAAGNSMISKKLSSRWFVLKNIAKTRRNIKDRFLLACAVITGLY
jgi:rhamnosyltransferase